MLKKGELTTDMLRAIAKLNQGMCGYIAANAGVSATRLALG